MSDRQFFKPSRRRSILLGGLAALIIILLIFAFMPQPVPVDFGRVESGSMIVTVSDEGKTRVRDIYTVSAPLDGRALRIDAEVGDPVEAYKTALAAIEPSSPSFLNVRTRAQAESAVKASEAAQSLAAAEVARAQAELEYAASELDRAERLSSRGNISKSALDRATLEVKTKQSALDTAEASLRVKDFELETAKASLIDPGTGGSTNRTPENCCVPIYAPVAGRVLQILHESEGVVSAGTPLVEIGDPRDLEIVVDLLSTDAVQVGEGDDVLIADWGQSNLLNGKVRRVEPFGFTKVSALGIEEQRVNVVIDLTDPPEDWRALGHGYRVETRIVTWKRSDALRIPLSALFRDGDRWSTFVNANGRAKQQFVTIEHVNEVEAEVIEGLEGGDEVILHPSERVLDGVRVEARPNSR